MQVNKLKAFENILRMKCFENKQAMKLVGKIRKCLKISQTLIKFTWTIMFGSYNYMGCTNASLMR